MTPIDPVPPAQSTTIPLFLNRASGFAGRGAGLDEIVEAFAEEGVSCDVREVHPAQLEEQLRRTQGAHTAIAVAGGDGTLHTAANVLAGSETALAPVPRGTFNYFARRLGLEDVAAAARAIADGHARTVPLGVLDDRLFLNTATFGVYAHLVRRRERFRTWLTKWPAAFVAYAMSLRRMQKLEIVLEFDGERLVRRTPLVWVGIGWGSFPRVLDAPERRASPDLEVAVLRTDSARRLIGFTVRTAFAILRGEQPIRDDAVEVLHARALILHARRAVDLTVDGETMRLRGPIFVAVQDDALMVVAPPAETAFSADAPEHPTVVPSAASG